MLLNAQTGSFHSGLNRQARGLPVHGKIAEALEAREKYATFNFGKNTYFIKYTGTKRVWRPLWWGFTAADATNLRQSSCRDCSERGLPYKCFFSRYIGTFTSN